MENPLLPTPPDEPKKKSRRKPKKEKLVQLPKLEVDFTLPPAFQILPAKDAAQSYHLGWHVSDVRSVNETLDLYNKLPRVCKGKDCWWAGQCPSAPNFIFEGYKCPLDILDVYRNFFRYVTEMEVSPTDHADLKMVEDLLRIDLQIKHIDQQIQLAGMESIKEVTMRNATSKEQVLHPLLTFQRGLRQDRNTLYEKLIISREAKKKAEAMDTRGKTDLLQWMYRMKEAAEKAKITEEEKPALTGEVIDVSPDDPSQDDYDCL